MTERLQPMCSATTRDGRPCGARARAGLAVCAAHDPETLARRAPGRMYSAHPGTVPRLEERRAALLRRIARYESAAEHLERARAQLAAVDESLDYYRSRPTRSF